MKFHLIRRGQYAKLHMAKEEGAKDREKVPKIKAAVLVQLLRAFHSLYHHPMMRKSSFTLLEILISISVAGILFGVLFSKIREFASLRKQVKQVEAECLERQTCQIRLQELFGTLVPSEGEKEKPSSLYTRQKNLFFQVERMIDADPAFVGKLDCIVQFDAASGSLYLTMKNSSGQERKEILGKEILSYTMRFYSIKEKTWQTDWPQKTSALPAFLSILCKKTFGDVNYLFALDVPTSAGNKT